MKIISSEVLSNLKLIQNNLKTHVKDVNININDYLTLDNETIIINIDDVSIGLLNALRQIAFKFDYIYYLDTNIANIYIDNTKNKSNINFINKTEISNRINGIIIDNNKEELLNKYVNSKIGYIKKKINYYNTDLHEYIKTNDITFDIKDLIILDKYTNICLLPYINGVFNIDNITLKKEYTMADSRFCNINNFTIIPINNDNKIISDDYDFNKIYKKYQIKITSIGCLTADKILPRLLNILYIKLQDTYIKENDYILYMQSGIYLENLLIEYSYNNNINILCKNIDNNIYCYNITIKEIEKIIELIKNDIIKLTSLLMKINENEAEKKLFNRDYSKYY